MTMIPLDIDLLVDALAFIFVFTFTCTFQLLFGISSATATVTSTATATATAAAACTSITSSTRMFMFLFLFLTAANISATTTTGGVSSVTTFVSAFSPSLKYYRHVGVGVGVGVGIGIGINNNNHHKNGRRLLLLFNSKWDDLVDDDEELPTKSVQSSKTPPDMKYIPRHVARQHTNFCDIRDAGGVEMTNDVYVRDPNHNTTSATSSSSSLFWFVGKVARVSDVTLEQCVARQYDLIAQHAVNLRPLELGLLSSSSSSASSSLQLELWTAPGDSELRVAYNEPDLVMVKMERDDDDDDANNGGEASKVNKNFVGFQGEIYDQGEEGFRTWRTGDGRAAKPQIIPATTSSTTSSSTAAGGGAAAGGTDETVASQEEMDRLLKVMDGLDVNELYKQQEKREGRQVED